jgi:hypothetical protein
MPATKHRLPSFTNDREEAKFWAAHSIEEFAAFSAIAPISGAWAWQKRIQVKRGLRSRLCSVPGWRIHRG